MEIKKIIWINVDTKSIHAVPTGLMHSCLLSYRHFDPMGLWVL